MEELAKDFEILIVAWLKSDDENATNLAYSLSKHAQALQLLQLDVIKSVCEHEYITDANWKSLTCRLCNNRIEPMQTVL